MQIFNILKMNRFADVTPGKCYYVSRHDDLLLVLAVDPAIQDDPPALLLLDSKTGTAAAELINGGGFSQDIFAELIGCTVVPSSKTEDLRLATRQQPPIGALIISQDGLVIVADGGGGHKVMINAASGATVERIPQRCFWFSKWQIGMKNIEGVFQNVCSINL